jgi:hypothetical protein
MDDDFWFAFSAMLMIFAKILFRKIKLKSDTLTGGGG